MKWIKDESAPKWDIWNLVIGDWELTCQKALSGHKKGVWSISLCSQLVVTGSFDRIEVGKDKAIKKLEKLIFPAYDFLA